MTQIVTQLLNSVASTKEALNDQALYRPSKIALGGPDAKEGENNPVYKELSQPRNWDTENWINKAVNWKGRYIWYSGPRGAGLSEVLRQRILLLNSSGQKMLILLPFNRQVEAWNLWALNHNVLLEAHTPESLAYKFTHTFHEELGYSRPPEWADESTQTEIQSIWEEVQQGFLNQFFKNQKSEEIKSGAHTLMLSNPTVNNANAQGNIEQIFFTRIIQQFQETNKINPHLAHALLSHVLPTRGDICREIDRQFPLVFIDGPEHMDPQIFKWMRVIKHSSITITSNYPFKSQEQEYPWMEKGWANPDARQQMEHQHTVMGIQTKKWSQCAILHRHARGGKNSNINISPEDTHNGRKINLEVDIKKIKEQSEKLSSDYGRNLHLTIYNKTNETGKWVAEWILRFHKANQRGNLAELSHEIKDNIIQPPAAHPLLEEGFNDNSSGDLLNPEKGIQILLVSPVSSYHDPRIKKWEEYLLNSFTPIMDIQPQFCYLGTADGPDQVGAEKIPQKSNPTTIWIGSPLAAIGTQFDLVLIPELTKHNWPISDSIAWDWLDICASRARWACMAYAQYGQTPKFLDNHLKNLSYKDPSYTTLKFSPLFQKNS
jgi:hypothetical protein